MANTAKEQYNASSITVLEGLEAVRKRPGMYIGGVGSKGLNHLIYEIVDNSVDEHLAGYCDQIWVALEADGSCTVRDNGRGIPVEMHQKGVSAARVVMSTLHAGGKFDNNAYKTSGGLHGVGSSVVNALSTHLDLRVCRGGYIYHDAYERGIPVVELVDGLLPVIGKTKETGTQINFSPDGEIFEKTRFKADWLKSRLHETAYLNPGLTIHYANRRPGEAEEIDFHEPDGIVAYVKQLNAGKTPVHDPIYFKGNVEGVEVEAAIQFVDTFEENILGFCNNIFTQEGGTHLAGFKTKFTALINSYARELGILKEKDANFTGADTRNGMTAVIAVKHPDPIFEGQTLVLSWEEPREERPLDRGFQQRPLSGSHDSRGWNRIPWVCAYLSGRLFFWSGLSARENIPPGRCCSIRAHREASWELWPRQDQRK